MYTYTRTMDEVWNKHNDRRKRLIAESSLIVASHVSFFSSFFFKEVFWITGYLIVCKRRRCSTINFFERSVLAAMRHEHSRDSVASVPHLVARAFTREIVIQLRLFDDLTNCYHLREMLCTRLQSKKGSLHMRACRMSEVPVHGAPSSMIRLCAQYSLLAWDRKSVV